MDYNHNNQFQSIIDENKKANEIYKELLEIKQGLVKKETALALDNETLNKQLVKINNEINNKKELIDRIISSSGSTSETKFSSEYLDQKCRQNLKQFLFELSDSNFNQFKVEYMKITLMKQLKDQKMTFGDLKIEVSLHIGKKFDEFFFSDENGMIYLDNLNVRRVLFPLSKVGIIGYIPVIKIVEKMNQIDNFNKIEILKDLNINMIEEKKDKPQVKKKKHYMKEKIFKFFIFFTFLILIILYIVSIITYRNVNNYYLVNKGYEKIFMELKKSTIRDTLIDSITSNICNIFQIRTLEEINSNKKYYSDSIRPFNRFVNHMNYIRITQKRNSSPCSKQDFINSFKNKACSDNEFTSSSKFNITGINYYEDLYPSYIHGIYGLYDNSGYYIDLKINDAENLHDQIETLKKQKFIDDYTASIKVSINLYDINLDVLVLVNVLYETNGSKLGIFSDYELIQLNPQFDYYLIFSLLLSLPFSAMFIFLIKKNIPNKVKLKKVFCKYIRNNFRMPDIFELITIVNMIIYYICISMRYSYYKDLNNLYLSKNKFNELFYISYVFKKLIYLHCTNLLLFIFTYVKLVSLLFKNFVVLMNTLHQYIFIALRFFIVCLVPLLFSSVFCGYFLIGDFSLPHYKNKLFVILRTIGTIYRGTYEDSDFRSEDKSEFFKLIKYSENSFYNLSIDCPGYIIFTLIFIFIVIITKSIYTAFFLVAYKVEIDKELILKKKNN